MYLTNEQLDRLIDLAAHAKTAYDNYLSAHFPTGMVTAEDYLRHRNSPEAVANRKADQALSGFMSQLDYEALLDVEALMQYGRELYSCDGIDALRAQPEPRRLHEAQLLQPAAYVAEARADLQARHPSAEEKPGAVDYLMGKLPLSAYLRCAREALRPSA